MIEMVFWGLGLGKVALETVPRWETKVGNGWSDMIYRESGREDQIDEAAGKNGTPEFLP